MTTSPTEDPVLQSSRKEFLIVVTVILGALAWMLFYCYGTDAARPVPDGEPIPTTLGFPSWVFWGILVPWLACIAISWYFGSQFMTDDALGEEDGGEECPL